MNALFFASALFTAALTVDDKLPAGNVIVEKIDGDTVSLRQDLRGMRQGEGWFYWAFRVRGAAGRTLNFNFTDPYGGGPVGLRGPVVSTDRGKTFSYPLDGQARLRRFAYRFAPDADEVWFYECHPYVQKDWDAFLARHESCRGKAFETGVLCKSKKGRAVEKGVFGCLANPKWKILVSSRHHASESVATFVLEGFLAAALADDGLGAWYRTNVAVMAVPFMDKDGCEDGEQGKNRAPHDHNRDYTEFVHPETRATVAWIKSYTGDKLDAWIDFHCPWIRGEYNEFVYSPLKRDVNNRNLAAELRFDALLEKLQTSGLNYKASDDLPYGKAWNKGGNYAAGWSCINWAINTLPEIKLGHTFEIPFASANGAVVTPDKCRAFGRDVAHTLKSFLEQSVNPSIRQSTNLSICQSPPPSICQPPAPSICQSSTPSICQSPPPSIRQSDNVCIDGIYPHLAMSNDEGECGTGAVVPWAGSLWVVTYGPHCPCGSSDKLYQITPDLKRIVRRESVGGTPANRLIHRETNQLLIGPYVIDARGRVRVVSPTNMPGRLTGAARHLTDPANKVYVATMDNGLYSLDMRTLAVQTLQRDHNGEDGRIWGQKRDPRFPRTFDWDEAVENVLPGSHTKGACSGFGRIQLANNGEYHEDALTNPWIPAGVLGDCDANGRDQRVIRRCQFTDITTRDGICGNEHPATNPIWALGWDAKSVILAVTTNGSAWTYYRLPKASHCYDGAHGWNTEWPRIRDVGEADLLATMHGTFWKFPRDFSPAQPNGIRPISTYLKVIGDFCRWDGRIVFGCDDHAKCEFLGKRKLKADQPKNERSTSNLWFVKPGDLATFGPPTGEGWVWCNEDVRAGDVSDPYLWAGYAVREFAFVGADGRDVPHEMMHDGDWVRVKALADAKGASAHFIYAPPKPATLPALDAKQPFIDITDDNGKVFRFPNVNGDTNVVCREVVTERDLLYVGGVFYEVPAENAGGFAALRPVALADEPVRSITVDRGLIVINGKRMVLDSLWKNGTAAQAYWLWRKHFKEMAK